MPFDFKQLRYAVTVAECGSFHRAADALRLKQSTLSRRIRQMEQRIGTDLFERSRSGMRPTLAGVKFLRYARRLIEEAESMTDAARAAGRGEAGQLTIGFYASLSAGNLRATLVEYRRRYSTIEIRLVQDVRNRLLAGIDNGSIDVTIDMGDPGDANEATMPLWTERVLVTLPEAHPAAAQETINWAQLGGETFLLARHEGAQEFHDFLIARLASPNGRPTIVRHDINGEAIRCLVGAGFGVSLVTDAAIGTTYAGVVYREPRGDYGPYRIGFMAQWSKDNTNPTLQSFLKLLQERYPRLSSRE